MKQTLFTPRRGFNIALNYAEIEQLFSSPRLYNLNAKIIQEPTASRIPRINGNPAIFSEILPSSPFPKGLQFCEGFLKTHKSPSKTKTLISTLKQFDLTKPICNQHIKSGNPLTLMPPFASPQDAPHPTLWRIARIIKFLPASPHAPAISLIHDTGEKWGEALKHLPEINKTPTTSARQKFISSGETKTIKPDNYELEKSTSIKPSKHYLQS